MIKAVKIFTMKILFCILLISIVLAIIPTSGARPTDIYLCYSVIKFDFDSEAANDPFLPIDMVKEINATLEFYAEGYFAEEIVPTYDERLPAYIQLKVINKPEWCTVSLSPDFLKIVATTTGEHRNFTIIVKVDQNAHADAIGTIGIEARVSKLGAIIGGTFYTNISFRPGYLPLLKLTLPKNPISQIGPLETAIFDIDIENLGNAKTLLTSHIMNVPDDWTVTLQSSTVIGTSTIGDDPKKTIRLTVQPSNAFGYHNEREMIQISVTPSMFDDPMLKGDEYFLSFIVQSRGFSTPGFKAIITLVAIMFITIIIKNQRSIKGRKIINKTGEDNL